MKPIFLLWLAAGALGALPIAAAEPVRLIFDTDMGNDCDDALALAMIHSLERRGEVKLLAVTITKDNRDAAAFIDLVDRFYGRSDIPIGLVRKGKTPEDAPMLKVPIAAHHHTLATEPAEAVELLKKVLAAQPDHSVSIAQVGFSTNLARLVATAAGRDLAARKVKTLYLMAGNFAEAKREYNVYTDGPAFADLMKNWPGPVVFSGFEVGLVITFPIETIEKDFAWSPNNPVVQAYRAYVGKPADHPNWDSTAVLQAIRPDRGYFDVSKPGRVTLGEKDTTVFTADEHGNCRYLILKQDQIARVRQLIADLVGEPAPHRRIN